MHPSQESKENVDPLGKEDGDQRSAKVDNLIQVVSPLSFAVRSELWLACRLASPV